MPDPLQDRRGRHGQGQRVADGAPHVGVLAVGPTVNLVQPGLHRRLRALGEVVRQPGGTRRRPRIVSGVGVQSAGPEDRQAHLLVQQGDQLGAQRLGDRDVPLGVRLRTLARPAPEHARRRGAGDRLGLGLQPRRQAPG